MTPPIPTRCLSDACVHGPRAIDLGLYSRSVRLRSAADTWPTNEQYVALTESCRAGFGHPVGDQSGHPMFRETLPFLCLGSAL